MRVIRPSAPSLIMMHTRIAIDAPATGGVQNVLLNEAAVEELAVEDLVAAVDGGVDEPGDDPHRSRVIVDADVAALPNRHVGAEQLLHHGDIAVLDGVEQPVGDVGDSAGVRFRHGVDLNFGSG